MSFIKCIADGAAASMISTKKVDEFLNKYQGLVAKYEKAGQSSGAAHQAANDAVAQEVLRTIGKEHANIRHANKINEVNTRLDGQKGKIEKKVSNLYQNAAYAGEGVRATMYSLMDELGDKIKGNFLGLKRDNTIFEKAVRHALGEATDNAEAKQLGDLLSQVFDYGHSRLRSAGANIGKIDNYFPQIHKKEAIINFSKSEWGDYIEPLLDREKMINPETSLPFSDLQLRKIIDDTYDDIITGGRSSLQKRIKDGKVTAGAKGGDVNAKREASRFFHFKNADAFIKYNSKFGTGKNGLIDAFLGHVDSVSKDIGLLETLGPKPDAMSRFLNLKMEAEGASKLKQKWTDAQYKVIRGLGSGDADALWYKVVTGTQNWIRSSVLGAASLSAISDTAFIAATARINGLSVTKTMGTYAALFTGSSTELKEIAKRVGFNADIINSSVLADTRFAGQTSPGKITGTLSSMTNKLSGLQHMTNAAKDAISLEALSHVGERITKQTPWQKLDTDLTKSLEAFGISEKDWGVLLRADVFDTQHGSKFLITNDFRVDSNLGVSASEANRIANGLDQWIFSLRALAANEGNLAVKALTTGAAFGDGSSGSLSRVLANSLFMFKTFPISVILNHMIPAVRRARVERKFDHLAMVTMGTTMLGAVAMHLKDLAKGKKQDKFEFDPKFLMAAMMQGGGAGLFGDFLLGDFSRFGRSPITELTGPMTGLADDIFRSTKGNFDRFVDSRDTNFKRDVFRVTKRNVPVLSSLWYARLGVERVLFDNIERLIDPNFDRRTRRLERKMQKENNKKFWWRPGADTPGGR